jgi:hypothetical protein
MKINQSLCRYCLIALLSGLFMPLHNASAAGVTTGPVVDPFALYDGEIAFDVFRNGSKVGAHRTLFARDGADITVRSTFNLQIDFLFFTAYRFTYQSEGRWRAGNLEKLTAKVDDDGTPFSLQTARDGARMKITKGSDVYYDDIPLYPTNHWTANVLTQNRVLNTLTGEINRVSIVPAGRETVTTERGNVTATRYRYTGDLETEVWYDDERHWVKMRFAGRDGSSIEYVCRRCQGGPVRETMK